MKGNEGGGDKPKSSPKKKRTKEELAEYFKKKMLDPEWKEAQSKNPCYLEQKKGKCDRLICPFAHKPAGGSTYLSLQNLD